MVNVGIPLAAFLAGTGALFAAIAPFTGASAVPALALIAAGGVAMVVADVGIVLQTQAAKARGKALDVNSNHIGGMLPPAPLNGRNQQSKRCGSSPSSGGRGFLPRAPGSPVPDGAET